MGILKAGIGAASSVLADSWRDYFYCDALPADTLAIKASKRTGKGSSNTKGNDNIISNGSIIAVADGQCMLIVDQGKVTEICAEPGEFVYDVSTEPSLFYGNLSSNIAETFKKIGKRIGFGGDAGNDQRVYYINTKDIIGNKYGTANPVPFRVVDRNIGLDVDIAIRCHGEYSYKIIDPILFYTNLCGNFQGEYKRENIESQLKSELLTALQPAFAKISETGVRYSALPGHTTEIADALNDVLSSKWGETYGIKISTFGINSVNASEEDEKMIKELQKNAVYSNPNMAAGALVGAQAQAMQDAAKNTSTGPMMAFAGMNMAQQAGGANAANLFAMGQQQAQAAPQPAPQPAPQMQPQSQGGWTCSCGTVNNGNFCSNCGQPKPSADWTCSCGTVNSGNFCSNCGKPRA
ncbi:SPFH domain-containing protein [Butyrivibrio sp. AC2005]|uniref:SPFH domain-containing protein n=1 Tax=Butyrivibrio sp. AC2005 TaxID=1280672 RepID=UPI000423E4A1|nr:SPFH domain-containing protein [Butyrivibrio sp. AC2005]